MRTALTTAKIAAVEPIPIVSVRMTAALNTGTRRSDRIAYEMSPHTFIGTSRQGRWPYVVAPRRFRRADTRQCSHVGLLHMGITSHHLGAGSIPLCSTRGLPLT